MSKEKIKEIIDKPISARQISTKLKPFGISSKTMRIGYGKPQKGYALDDFEDVFQRYLSDLSVTTLQSSEINGLSGNAMRNTTQNVTDENTLEALENSHCYDVTDEEYEERAAIMEHDAGLNRDEAELAAKKDMKQ